MLRFEETSKIASETFHNHIETDNHGHENEGDLRSLQLAMRLEAENILLSHISQLATLQLFDRHNHYTNDVDTNNPNNINPDQMTYEVKQNFLCFLKQNDRNYCNSKKEWGKFPKA